MDYSAAVTEFKNLDESIETGQWRQAQLAWQMYQDGATQVQIAEDVGKKHHHISVLIRMWGRWSSTTKPEWTSAYAEIAEGPDWEEKQALRRARSAISKLTDDQKAEVIDDAIDELPSEQQAQVVDKWATPDRLTHDERDQVRAGVRDVERTAREREAARVNPAEAVELEFINAVTNLRNDAMALVAEFSHRSFALSDEGLRVVAGEVAGLRNAVEQIAVFRKGESIDDEFARMEA